MQSLCQTQRAQLLSGKAQRARPNGSRVSAAGVVRCVASHQVSRRDALLSGAAVVASPLLLPRSALAEGPATFKYKLLPVEALGSFQRSDMKFDFQKRASRTIRENMNSSDASACVRLALMDAGAYDETTKTGGMSGAVILSGTPLPSYLQPTVEKLKKTKAAIDAGDVNGAGAISWADLLYLAAKITSQTAWRESKGAAGKQPGDPWSNPWDGVVLGRVDSTVQGPNKVPEIDAPVEEVRAFLLALGAKPGSGGFLQAKPPFWEKPGFLIWCAGAPDQAAEEARLAAGNAEFESAKQVYDKARRSLDHANYEIDFSLVFNKLCNLGAKFNPDAYLFPLKVMDIKI